MAEFNLGQVTFFDKGLFSLSETYTKWDFVTTTDSTYLCVSDTPIIGKEVTNTTYWKCIADGKPATLAAALAAEKALYATEQGDYAKNIGDTYDAVKVSKTTLETTEEVAAQSFVELKERIDALEELLKQGLMNSVIIKTLSVETFQMDGAPLILTGTDAPAIVPDFIGQFYIKTTATTACYQSTGTTGVGDWKQIG